MSTTAAPSTPAPVSARVGRCLDCAAELHRDPATGRYLDRWDQAICGANGAAHIPDLPTPVPYRPEITRVKENQP
jgi:hypothetical protein